MSGGSYPPVAALAVAGSGKVYAGGGFTTAAGVSAYSIARWDGASWAALGLPGAGLESGETKERRCRSDNLDGRFLGVLRFNVEKSQWLPDKVFI
jgi:hypothetical protein